MIGEAERRQVFAEFMAAVTTGLLARPEVHWRDRNKTVVLAAWSAEYAEALLEVYLAHNEASARSAAAPTLLEEEHDR